MAACNPLFMSEPRRWLISRRADFWFATAGASGALLAALAFIFFFGDREFDWLDLVFSELHLGATYDAVIRRRLWQRRPVDVLLLPLLILTATYALISMDHWVLVTSIGMYAAIWHRGRQNFGLARFYQRLAGGPASPTHQRLFSGAIYAPMAAAFFLYSHLAPEEYEGDPYYSFNAGAEVAWSLGLIALGCVAAYLLWAWRHNGLLHPGERWIVLAHAVAFGSAYVLGATQTSFLFVLTVHHEVQYLYFTYAMANRENYPSEIRFAASYAVWPVIGLAGTVGSSWYPISWLAPLGVGGLFCHYWLDGRIWTRRSME
jgi:hypothetical protein